MNVHTLFIVCSHRTLCRRSFFRMTAGMATFAAIVTAAATGALTDSTPAWGAEPTVQNGSSVESDAAFRAAIHMAEQSLQASEALSDYECIFHKRERHGRKLLSHKMVLKYRHEPFSVYMKYIDPYAGREVLYVDGKFNNKLLAHETGLKGLAGTLAFDPVCTEAMAECRYPVTKIGMHQMMATVLEQWKSEERISRCEVTYYPNAKLGDRDCKVIATTHPKELPGLKFCKTRLYIDKETNLPVRVEQYGFPTKKNDEPLLEEYTYSELRLNAGLDDFDFSPKNSSYAF